MTKTNEKLRALFLTALMVFSVVGGTVAFAGTAAAGNADSGSLDYEYGVGNDPGTIEIPEQSTSQTNVTFNVNDLNEGGPNDPVNFTFSVEDDVEFTGVTSVTATSADVTENATVKADGDIEFSLTPDSNNTDSEITLENAVFSTPAVSENTTYTETLTINDSQGTNTTTFNTVTVVESSNLQTGFLSGRVSDQNNEDVPNATVTAVSQDGLIAQTQTNSQGEYTLEVPAGTYDLTVERDGYSTAQATNQVVEPDKTTTANLVIRQLINADDITVVDSNPVAVSDGTERAEFTVQVTTNDTDSAQPEPLADTEVVLETNAGQDGSAVNVTSDMTIQTDSNGEATFNLTSNVTQDVELTFEATEGDSVTTSATASFIPESGQGVFVAQVKDKNTAAELSNATVYAVQEDRFDNNDISFVNNTSVSEGDQALFRVVNNETGEVVDNADYDITYGDSSDFVRVDELNESDLGVGSGFLATAGTSDSGSFNFTVTPIEAGDYYVQRTDVGDTENPADGNFSDVTNVTTVNENLTAAATADRAANTDSNPVAQTNGNAQATLTNLFANGKVGVDYVVMAERADYSRQYQDANITSYDTTDSYTERTFLLEEREVTPDTVDIVQVGTHPPLSETGGAPDPSQITPFDDQSDETFQQVPRDGSIDVIVVSAGATNFQGDQTPVNTTVTVSLNETFDGQFLDALGGQVVMNDQANATITVSTGADGTATVLLETEQNSSTLDVTKTATIESDTSVTDSSNTTFVGTTVVQESEVSGIVTNENNNPVPANVYIDEFDLEGDTFTVEPVDFGTGPNGETVLRTFEITRESTNQTATFNASYTGDSGDYDFADFPGVSLASGTESLTLATLSSSGVQESSSYTLPRAPTLDQDDTDESTVVVTGASDATVQDGNLADLNTGTAVSTLTEPDRTSTANIEITGAAGGPFAVDNPAVTPSNVSTGETVTVSADISNDGGVTAATSYTVTLNGSTTTETTSTIPAGQTASVSTDIDTSGLAPGTYDVRIDTVDDFAVVELTVESGSTSVVDQFDANNDGEISQDELTDAAIAFSGGDITQDELTEVAVAFASS